MSRLIKGSPPAAQGSAKVKAWMLVLSMVLISAQLYAKEVGYYGYGRMATVEEIAGWDIDVRPDGTGLPPGQGSVQQGEVLYEEKCAVCHGAFGEGAGRWPMLAGGFATLTEERPEKTVGSYWPYVSTLWDYIHRAMPFFNPQSLSDDQVYALTAYVLYLNELVDEDFILTEDNLVSIEMPNSGNFYPDPRPDVNNTACMENCKNPEDIKITWDTTESEGVPATPVTPEQALVQGASPVGQTNIETGRRVYNLACIVCHGAGIAGAPKTGDKNAWIDRINQGPDLLIKHSIEGFRGKIGYMPPRGGNSQLSDEEVTAAVTFMIEQSRAKDSQF